MARLVLHAHEKPLREDELTFTLRHLGYRFQPATLRRILYTSPTIKLDGHVGYGVNRTPAGTAQLRTDLALDPEGFRTVLGRLQRRTRAALRERRRRLALVHGLAVNDPIYQEGNVTSNVSLFWLDATRRRH